MRPQTIAFHLPLDAKSMIVQCNIIQISRCVQLNIQI